MQYNLVVKNIISTSTRNGQGIEELKKLIKFRLVAFAGQSAVGKSSLLNAIFPGLQLNTGELSDNGRGKHTTRVAEIFWIDGEYKVADTPGFSMLELENIKPEDLHEYYSEFTPYEKDCEFKDCKHINVSEKVCAVARAVFMNRIHKERYKRYCKLYEELKEKWEKKYD